MVGGQCGCLGRRFCISAVYGNHIKMLAGSLMCAGEITFMVALASLNWSYLLEKRNRAYALSRSKATHQLSSLLNAWYNSAR